MPHSPIRIVKQGKMGHGKPKVDVVLRSDDASQVSEITFPAVARRQTSNASSSGGGGSQVSQSWCDEMMLEDAEQALLDSLDFRRPKAFAMGDHGDGFQPAVHGERPPLGAALGKAFDIEQGHTTDNYEKGTSAETENTAKWGVSKPRVSLTDIAKRVRLAQRVTRLRKEQSARELLPPSSNDSVATTSSGRHGDHRHRRVATLLASIDEDSRSEVGSHTRDAHIRTGDLGALLQGAPDPDDDDAYVQPIQNAETPSPHPFVSSASSNTASVPDESQPLLNSPTTQGRGHRMQHKKISCGRTMTCIEKCCRPTVALKRIYKALLNSSLILAIPLFVVALILFYCLGDPELDFLPGEAGLAWWLNFLGRQLLMLDCARFTQWIVIDCLTLRSKHMVNFMGPWVTIFLIQSNGWPFIFTAWGLWDLCLLHGNNLFQRHWLYFTDIRIYSSENTGRIDGQYIINSEWYLHFLLSFLIAGILTAIKRTAVSVYFGRRNFEEYKPKLEAILNDIIIISEVAELAESADTLPEEYGVSQQEMLAENLSKKKRSTHVRWSSVKFSYNTEDDSIDKDSSTRGRLDTAEVHPTTDGEQNMREAFQSATPVRRLVTSRSRNSSGELRIRNLLDRWDEPMNKSDRAINSTINDILKFRKALTYMDLQHPFSLAFGLASTRDQCIVSAQNVYQRLLKLSPGSKILTFDILRVLAIERNGVEDPVKLRSIRNLFRPDAANELPLIAFIQSCDTVYKKLRYFRASVGNSSVIDKVLEGIIDAIFGFILALAILQFNSFNPWPILVSMSTLLVTFTFAFGPSAAKSIEGILMITARRPYDIGDRIVISDSAGAVCGDNSLGNSWFVEDITLFNTTLRFANSNEVATVSNSTLSSSRIINCARSNNALVSLYLKLNIKLHQGHNLDLFRESIDNYVSDNPRIWNLVLIFRCEEINPDLGYVLYKLVVRSRHSWQVAPRVLQNRSELWQFCTELSERMNITYSSPIPRLRSYLGRIDDLERPSVYRESQTMVTPETKKPAVVVDNDDRSQDTDAFLALVQSFHQ